MNWLWKHLTNTSINLRSRFKGIVKDAKRIVGSKNFTAISLFGAYPCGLLIDELVESNNTYDTEIQMNALKNSSDIIECRRGLLPLLVPEIPEIPEHDTLFARMVVRLLILDIRINMVIECCKEIRAGFAAASIDINHIMSQMYNTALQTVLTQDLNIILDVIVASIIDTCNAVVIPVAGSIPPAAAANIRQNVINRCSEIIYSTNNILLFLGFLFSIKIKSNASIGPRNMLSLVDSIINFYNIPNRDLLLTYTGNQVSCSLAELSTNPDSEACATGGQFGGVKKAQPQQPRPPQPAQQTSKGVTKKEAERQERAKQAEEKRIEREMIKIGKEEAKIKIAEEERKKKAERAIRAEEERTERAERAAGLSQLLHPQLGPFKKFMDKIYQVTLQIGIIFEPKTCVTGTRQEVYDIDRKYTDDPTYSRVRLLVGGGDNTRTNKTKSNNKISKTNNHTRKNKYKRNNKNKKHKSSPKYRKINPSSRSGSQSNRKKSKSKITHKSVTFRRRMYNN
jgi:hypothetical protein